LFHALFRKWDLAIVLNTVSHSLTSDILAGLSGSRIVLGSSVKPMEGTSGNLFYHLLAPYQPGVRHQTDRNLDIVRYIGADTTDLSEMMFLSESECREGRSRLVGIQEGSRSPLIAMHLGAGKLKNRWPPKRFAHVACELRDKCGATIVLCWGPHEHALATEFRQLVDFEIVNVPPGTLRTLAAIISQCDLLICNDTGIMHLGASVGLPLVAIFGPTDPVEWKPVGENVVAIRGDDETVDSVTVESVLEGVLELIRKIRSFRKA
jgi:heptosyltransferase-2